MPLARAASIWHALLAFPHGISRTCERSTFMPAKAKTTLKFFVNGHKVETDEEELTGAAIKALGEVPTGEVLYLREHGAERRIEDDTVVELKNGMQFMSAPDGNVS
jgi:hypothetical protein